MTAEPLETLVTYNGEPYDENGIPWVRLSPDGTAVLWRCPLCHRGYYGRVGQAPVSGWESPVWTVTQGEAGLTLMPSLGCRGMVDGTCPGHWWVRDGKLEGDD